MSSAAAASSAPVQTGTSSAAASCPAPKLGKSGKKICCSCPETKKVRDACVIEKGEIHCKVEIEAHKACLRLEGFDVA